VEAMTLRDCGPLAVGCLLVRLIVAMVWVEKIAQLANFMLEMRRLGLNLVEGGI